MTSFLTSWPCRLGFTIVLIGLNNLCAQSFVNGGSSVVEVNGTFLVLIGNGNGVPKPRSPVINISEGYPESEDGGSSPGPTGEEQKGPWVFQGAYGPWVAQSYDLETGRIDGENNRNISVTETIKVNLSSTAQLSGEVAPVSWAKLGASISQTLSWEVTFAITWNPYSGRVVLQFLSPAQGMSIFWSRRVFNQFEIAAKEEIAWGWAIQANSLINRWKTL